jgi:hypothetical protein
MILTLRSPGTAHTINTITLRKLPSRRTQIGAAALISVGAAVFALYAIEAILASANPSWIDKLGTTLRRGPSVVDETMRIRSSHSHAFPFLQPDTYIDSTNRSVLSVNGTTTIPLSGPTSALTILCNESGTTIGYRSDSLGFRNPPDAWDPLHPDVAIIGDSFAHGFCRPDTETIAGRLRVTGLRVLNAGITGAGPLAELGIVREFLTEVKPKHVYWLFYEGNDLIDIESEKKTALNNYLRPEYSQGLLERRAGIDSAIRDYSNAMFARHRTPTLYQKLMSFVLLRKLRTATGLYRQPESPVGNEIEDVRILRSVLGQADSEVKAWGGDLTLVYLPERRRFNKRTAAVVGENHDPLVVQQRVKRIASDIGIPMLDVAETFARHAGPAKFWNSRRYHYNAQGYALVADVILGDLAKH